MMPRLSRVPTSGSRWGVVGPMWHGRRLLSSSWMTTLARLGPARTGRRIYDNLRKAMAYVLAIHVPIAGLSVLPLVLGWPLFFSPVHIVFLELVIDPVCCIVLEAEGEEEGVMHRPPRDRKAPLFSRGLLGWSLLQGVMVLLVV